MFLTALNIAIGYRFHRYARSDRFEFPPNTPASLKEGTQEIKDKARASVAVAGMFLAFGAAFVAALISIDKLDSALEPLSSISTGALVFSAVVLPFLISREQRRISAAHVEASGRENAFRRKHYRFLLLWCAGLIITFIPAFYNSSIEVGRGLALSGFFLVLISLILLILSVEFYDTAGGWQAADDPVYHFHMASIAGHCYLIGLSVGLVGISLLACRKYPRTGCIIAAIVLTVLMAMTQIEREMYELHELHPHRMAKPQST